MTAYQEKHYYLNQQAPRKGCCGCKGNGASDAEFENIKDMLRDKIKIQSLGGKDLANVFGECLQSDDTPVVASAT